MPHRTQSNNSNRNSDPTLNESLAENLKGYQELVSNLTDHLGRLADKSEEQHSALINFKESLSKQLAEMQKQAEALQKRAETFQRQVDDSRKLIKEMLLDLKEFRSGRNTSGQPQRSPTNHHIDDRLDLI